MLRVGRGLRRLQPTEGLALPQARRNTRLALAALTLLAPLGLFALLECALRVGGVGSAPTLFSEIEGRDAYTTNLDFAERFFSGDTTIRPVPAYFGSEKSRDSYRIFVLGGSAAFGDLMPEYGFSRVLGVLLNERYPKVRFEVVNAAVAAVNSHIVLPVLREAAGYDADLFVVYLGNNEVVGPYGPGAVGTSTGMAGTTQSLWRIRASLWARRLRVGQLARRIGGLAPRGDASSPLPDAATAMERLQRTLVRPGDPDLERSYAHFARNLEDMVVAAEAHSANLILVTVASNLRDFAPFASLHPDDVDVEAVRRFRTALSEGRRRHARGDCEGALLEFGRIAAIDPEFAELHFRRGSCLLDLDREDEAREALGRARDLDLGRYRADSRINAIIRDVAAASEASGATLVDAERRFEESGLSLHGLPGSELFYDHVHLTFEGSYLLARSVLPAIEAYLPDGFRSDRTPAAPASIEAVADALALTNWDLDRLSRPLGNRSEKLAQSRGAGGSPVHFARRREGESADSREVYRRAIERAPDDLLLRRGFAELLSDAGDAVAAAEQLRVLVERVPVVAEWRVAYGISLMAMGEAPAALLQLERAVQLAPADFNPRFHLGNVLRELGRDDDAMVQYERVLDARPYQPAVHHRMGLVRLAQGNLDPAVTHLETALRGLPNSSGVHTALGVALFAQGKRERAVGHLREAVRLDPEDSNAREQLQAALRQLRVSPHAPAPLP